MYFRFVLIQAIHVEPDPMQLSRITSFYGKGDSLPPILQKVKVEFNDMNNMFFGKFLEVV